MSRSSTVVGKIRLAALLNFMVVAPAGRAIVMTATPRTPPPRPVIDCGPLFVTAPVAPLKSWNDLPPVLNADLPDELKRRLDAHPLVRALRARLPAAHAVPLQMDPRADFGGWLIQSRFLAKIVLYVLPQADVAFVGKSLARSPLKLGDSTLEAETSPDQFDLSDLKVLNQGPPLPPRDELRARLGLPREARIVSVYSALKRSVEGRALVAELFTDPEVRYVVLSSQTAGAEFNEFSWHPEISLIDSQAWVRLKPERRPRRAIIFNRTRQRLPYLHAAADEVVVMGAANVFEPIFAGRPTYFDRFAERGVGLAGWHHLMAVAERSGLAHGYDSVDTFRALRERYKHAPVPPSRVSAADQDAALDRLLVALGSSLPR